jgi:hypothetical protein
VCVLAFACLLSLHLPIPVPLTQLVLKRDRDNLMVWYVQRYQSRLLYLLWWCYLYPGGQARNHCMNHLQL